MDCIFCKIINGEIPSQKIHETDKCVSFRDINPQTPEHILVVPKKHIADIESISGHDGDYLADLFFSAKAIAEKHNLAEKGYRIIFNNGKAAGQEVSHIHMHILGGMDSLGPMVKS